MLAGELLDSICGAEPALLYESEIYSFYELDYLSNQFANFFTDQGLKPHDRVSFLMNNDPKMVSAYFGAFRAGVIANPINNKLKPDEISYILSHAEPSLVVTSIDFIDTLERAFVLSNYRTKVLIVDRSDARIKGFFGLSDLEKNSRELLIKNNLDSKDGALLLYTSGTTGRPKGVLLTHLNIVSGIKAIVEGFNLSERDRTLCVMPLFHTNGLMFSLLSHLHAKSSVVLRKKFSASQFWSECSSYRITNSSASPTILTLLLEHQENAPPASEIKLDFLKVASAPTSKDLAERFESRFGKGLLLETFGLTETTAISAMNPLNGKRKVCSIGRALAPQRIKIVDDNGRDLPANQVGRMLITGPTVMAGYFRDKESTNRVISDGWIDSGDLASVDDAGYIFIVGRAKDMIIRGGENISPREIEDVSLKFSGVKEAVAVGIPDKIYGESVALAVVCDLDVDLAELKNFMSRQIGDFKVPSEIIKLKNLPRNTLGKIQREELKKLFQI